MTGLDYVRARWYSPLAGTWLTPDPAGYGADSSNLYAFGNGDPINQSDPTGLLCEKSNASSFWEWTKRCSADVWDVTKEWWAGDTRPGTTHGEEGPRDGETQPQYVRRLTASGVRNQDAALAGEMLFKNRQVSREQRMALAKGFVAAEKPVNVMAGLALAPEMAHPAVATLMAAESYRSTGGSLQTGTMALPLVGPAARTTTGLLREASVVAGTGLEEASWSQRWYSENFSPDGSKIYSRLAGTRISTIDDLADAIRTGQVSANDVPVEYIVRDGRRLILNTRTSIALERAGISRDAWRGVNVSGDPVKELLLDQQLVRNGLTETGAPFTSRK